MVEEEDLLDKLEDVDHPVCQQATDALLTAESEADQVWYGTTHRRIGSRPGLVRYDTSPNRKQIRFGAEQRSTESEADQIKTKKVLKVRHKVDKLYVNSLNSY